MDSLYHWVGFAVVWGFIILALAIAWEKRPRNQVTRRLGNAWNWLRTFLLHRPLAIPREWPRWVFAWYQPRRAGSLDGWERNIIAATIRHARRYGFTD